MRILMINKFYYVKGGSETYLFGLKKILEEHGHEVIPFSMKDDKNVPSEYDRYFINNIDYNDKNIFRKVKNATKIIYNFDANNNLKKLIQEVKPDIAHLHIFQHQMSPSILKILQKENIPIVYTMHDLKPVCLNYKMMNSKGICEMCNNSKYYKCLSNKCVKNSYLFSLINMIEGYVHKFLKSYNKIDKFITPSKFYKEKLIEAGFNDEDITHIPNFIDVNNFCPQYRYDDYFVYVGRLSEEKGIETLIKSMKKVEKSKLKIIGTGPIENKLRDLVNREQIMNIEFLGFKSGEELIKLISYSKFMVIPSEWYENAPMSVLEAMSMGKAIIGSDIGGIPELLQYNNGLIFKANNEKDLTEKINSLLYDIGKINKMGENSRKAMEEHYNSEDHYNNLIEIYNSLLSKKR